MPLPPLEDKPPMRKLRTVPALPPEDLERMQQSAGEASALLRVMGNEQRLLVLCQLLAGESSVGDLLTRVKLSQSALSQHLAVLREAGLVDARRSGQAVIYSLPAGPVHHLMQSLHDIYCGSPS